MKPNIQIKLELIDSTDFTSEFKDKAFKKAKLIHRSIIAIFIGLLIVLIIVFKIYWIIIFSILITNKFIFYSLNLYYRRQMPDWNLSDNKNGFILFTEDYIQIQELKESRTFLITEIEELEINNGNYKTNNYSDFLGEIVWGTRGYDLDLTNGISKIRLKIKDEFYEFRYLIENEFEFSRFKNLLRVWYSKKLNISEISYFSKTKTFLFDTYNKWNELEKVKEQFMKINN